MTSIVIDLPDEIVSQAREAGLLGSAQIGIIFQESLRMAARGSLLDQMNTSDAVEAELNTAAQNRLIAQAKQAARRAY